MLLDSTPSSSVGKQKQVGVLLNRSLFHACAVVVMAHTQTYWTYMHTTCTQQVHVVRGHHGERGVRQGPPEDRHPHRQGDQRDLRGTRQSPRRVGCGGVQGRGELVHDGLSYCARLAVFRAFVPVLRRSQLGSFKDAAVVCPRSCSIVDELKLPCFEFTHFEALTGHAYVPCVPLSCLGLQRGSANGASMKGLRSSRLGKSLHQTSKQQP